MTSVTIKPKSGTLPDVGTNFFWTARKRSEDISRLADLRAEHGFKRAPANLLTTAEGNAKLAKGSGRYLVGLNLQPASVSGWNVCANSTKECRHFCLATCGRNGFDNAFRARQYKTELLYRYPKTFLRLLASELNALRRLHGPLALRMNLLSDLPFHKGTWSKVIWEAIGNPFGENPNDSVRYEYTKNMSYFDHSVFHRVNFTYSARGPRLDPLDGERIHSVLSRGHSVALVSRFRPSVSGWVDGDLDDRRYLDGSGRLVFLEPKGQLAKSNSPFLYRAGDVDSDAVAALLKDSELLNRSLSDSKQKIDFHPSNSPLKNGEKGVKS